MILWWIKYLSLNNRIFLSGTERASVKWEHEATQWGGGSHRRGSPGTSSVSASAEGGAPVGGAGGAPAAGDVPLADILAQFESEEYLDTLQQLANSLLQEIGTNSAGATQDVSVHIVF